MKIAYYSEMPPSIRARSWSEEILSLGWEIIYPKLLEKHQPIDADWLISDFWFEEITTNLPKERCILNFTEPHDVLPLPVSYLNKNFGYIISPAPIPKYKGIWIQAPPCFPCTMDIDPCDMINNPSPTWSREELINLPIPKKTKDIAVIISNKAITPGHKLRKDFVFRLKELLGDKLDIYGRGIKFVEKKSDILLPYKYHLVIENCFNQPGWWTEKLSDAFWGYSFPIYAGNKDVENYFPKGSMLVVDINDPEASAKKILEALDSDLYSKSLSVVQETRILLANKYSPLQFLKPYLTTCTNAPINMHTRVIGNMRDARKKPIWQHVRIFLGKIRRIIR